MAVRLWTAMAIGSLVALVALPPFAGAVGPGWMIVPGLGLFVVAFWLTGMAFAAMGRRRLERLLGEATVWDRAGMCVEAETAFQKALALFHSFWLSPAMRQKKAPWFQGLLAKFYLGPSGAGPYARRVVAGYLSRNPRDSAVAESWLEPMQV